MRVNFHFTRILTNQLAVGSGIAFLMVAIFSIFSSFKDPIDRTLLTKEVNILIRQIGHRLLLQAGDSTSRVMPVTEVKEGTFLLKFENKFNFNHDSLQLLSQNLLLKTKFPNGYTVTVHDCKNGDIVYGFQINNSTPDILACAGRNQPRGCYTMEFAFRDLYENIERDHTAIGQRVNLFNSTKALPEGVNLKSDKLNSTTLNNDIDQGTKDLQSVKVNAGQANQKSKGVKSTTFNYVLNNWMYAGMLLIVTASILVWRFRKKVKPVPLQPQDHTIKETTPGLPSLGKFLFNVEGQRLFMGSEVISLTDKECKVLELLHKNFGELVTRETLMQEVWINEGVITGRSLDMFVSKLRKKLSGDAELRITNVHGKGYKLEISTDPSFT